MLFKQYFGVIPRMFKVHQRKSLHYHIIHTLSTTPKIYKLGLYYKKSGVASPARLQRTQVGYSPNRVICSFKTMNDSLDYGRSGLVASLSAYKTPQKRTYKLGKTLKMKLPRTHWPDAVLRAKKCYYPLDVA